MPTANGISLQATERGDEQRLVECVAYAEYSTQQHTFSFPARSSHTPSGTFTVIALALRTNTLLLCCYHYNASLCGGGGRIGETYATHGSMLAANSV